MAKQNQIKNKRVCSNGHLFFKSSDCTVCPICEQNTKPGKGFLSLLPAPARRALESEGIKAIKQLSSFSEKEILKLHGIGPASLPTLRKALKAEGVSFKK